MENRVQIVLLLVLVLCILCGCAEPAAPTAPTVQDIFNELPTTMPTVPSGDNTAATDATETIPKGSSEKDPDGTIQHGFAGQLLVNDKGRYNIYNGGEMHIDYHIMASGTLGAYGVGIMLLLDGKPQPYKTATDETYRYMHVFYAEAGQTMLDTVEEFIFIPVTGQNGDTLELTGFQVLNPSYYPSKQYIGTMQTFGSVHSGTQLLYESTPPAMEQVESRERVLSYSVAYVDLTSNETMNWSSEDLERNVSFVFGSQNPIDAVILCDVAAGEPLIVYAEVFGATAVDWSLIFYVDNIPVSALAENRISFHTKSGKKTVVEVTLDMSDFDGEGVIFALLCAKNWREPEVLNGTNCNTEITATYYLTDVSDWEEFNRKYGRGE